MFKTETHLHVAEVSPCSHLGAEEMISLYAREGYTTVFVSDHLRQDFFDRLGDLPWEEKTARFLEGYALAKAAGERCGVRVLLSAELELNESPNHYLLYGFDKGFFDRCPGLFDLSLAEFYAYAWQNGVTVVQAHPYRDGAMEPRERCIDALEVHNSNPRHENYTPKAIAFAQSHGLPMAAGSDAHRYEDVAKSGVLSAEPITSAGDYVRVLMAGELRLIGAEL